MNVESSKRPAIAIAGHLVYDEIVFSDGGGSNSFGGISYNLAALCAAMKGGSLIPVCQIGSDKRKLFDQVFGYSAVLDSSLISGTDFPNVVNRLVYDRDGHRKEWNSRKPGPLSLDGIPSSMDALLMNFISGDDVTPGDLNRFRSRFAGIIYMDYHSLALGRLPDGGREYRHNPLWKEYVSSADILQLNGAELSTITGDSHREPSAVVSGCRLLHQCGPKDIIITLGKEGIIVSSDDGDKAFLVHPVKIDREVDTTGCGDTVAAVALFNYLISKDIVSSAVEASRWAAAKATFSGIEGFGEIERILNDLGRAKKTMIL